MKSIGKLVARFDSVQGDYRWPWLVLPARAYRFLQNSAEAAELLLHLVQFTAEHREEARSLQQEITTFRAELQKALDEVWPANRGDTTDAGTSGAAGALSWAERMEEKKRERKSAIDRIVKPEITTTEEAWRVQLLDV